MTNFLRITLGVQRHKQNGNLICQGPQLAHDFSLAGEVCRADVGAVGEPEEQTDNCALELAERSELTRLIY